MSDSPCVFCRIVAREIPAATVYEDEQVIVFLDTAPLFPGHCLVCPKVHRDTMLDLEPALLSAVFTVAQRVAKALEDSIDAKGSFVCVNNRISQSVPHLHVHIIPRRPKDGMKGFFWPRRPYRDEEEMRQVAEKIRVAL
jgi:histidine triad (HIT) family protein